MIPCDRCLARSWLLTALGDHLESERARIEDLLELREEDLIAAVGGRRRRQLRSALKRLDGRELRERAREARLELICRCDSRYPARLKTLPSAPSALYVAGGLERFLLLAREDPVALVGSRRASGYGLEVGGAIARGLAAAGVTVLSGMALGIDSAAHAGALDAGAGTIAVLPSSPDHPYPPAKRALHRRILATGTAISELGPGARVWRWAFPARNRIIAGLAAMTVVVEAGERSGALLTARLARDAGRPLAAVPGRVTSPQAAGSNALLVGGAHAVRCAQDVLDDLFGAGARTAKLERRPDLDPDLRLLLTAISEGCDTAAALARAGFPAEQALAGLASLELAGYVRPEPGGRFSMLP